jgi:hypothetical protein|tara:strand:+ start:71 stop:202 length:132 start_codon:yes stop_codon:yes gene_type:complete
MKEVKKAAPKKPKIVKMERNGQLANVHPDEVANYAKGDWKEVK